MGRKTIRNAAFGYGTAFTTRKARDDEEWLMMRRRGIGGSDVAPIMGISPYRTALDVWLSKTGRDEGGSKQSEAMYWGTVNEAAIADRFAEEHPDMQVTRANMQLVSKESEVFLADLDRFVVQPDGTPAVLEIKTASAFKTDDWKHGTPAFYLTQVQHYLMVTGWSLAYVAVLFGGNQYKEYKVKRDEDDIAAIKHAELDFWTNYVLTDTMPEVVGSDCGTLADMHPDPSDDYVTPANYAEVDELIRQYQEAADAEKEASSRKKDAQAKLCQLIGDSKGMVTDIARVTWSRSESERFDAKAFQQANPDEYQKYCVPMRRSSMRITEAK